MKIKDELFIISNKGNNTEKKIASYLLAKENEIEQLQASDIAKDLYISNSVITKFIKKIGCDNFMYFKYQFEAEINSKENKEIYSYDDYTNDMIETITKTKKNVNPEDINEVADKIINSKRIVIFAIGGSYVVAYDLYLKLLKLGFDVILEKDIYLTEQQATRDCKDYVLIIISYSYLNEQLEKLNDLFKSKGSYNVLLTGKESVDKEIDQKLIVKSKQSMFRSYSITSRIGLNYITDILFLEIYKKVEKEKCFLDQ